MTTENTDFANLSQEQMIELANKVNAMRPAEAGATEAEAEARQASAAVQATNSTGPQSASDLAAEAAAFVAKNSDAEAEQAKKDAEALEAEAPAEAEAEAEATPFPTSEDPSLNAALNLMKTAGVPAEQVGELFQEAINTGDVSKVDMAKLEEQVGKDNATLVMAGVTKWAADAGAAQLEAAREVQASVGGAEAWNKMTAWAKTKAKADPAFKKEVQDITKMINGDATQRRLAAAEFKRLYNADPKNSTVGTTETVKADGVNSPKVETMTGSEAYAAKATLSRQRQLHKITQAEYNAGMRKIQAARNAGRASGK